ncbi:hypothetical protein [Streptomyces sp. NPDC051211]|uniref:hypothetical protein n=1 Tax=Streptomyces sp. NPDC051211 TaxID=3154643 RepID=UPI00344F64B8
MLRRLVAGAATLVLVAEAAVLVLVHVVLGRTTASQSMSIAGSDPDVMSKATYAMGAGIGAFLLLCAALLAVAAIRDRAPGRFARAVLIGAAFTHGILGALVVGLVGWPAFAVMMLILCLIVLALMLFPDTPDTPDTPKAEGADAAGRAAGGSPGPAEVTPTSP